MKKNIFLLMLFCAGTLRAQGTDPTPGASHYTTPTPVVIQKWSMSAIPWDNWFKSNPYNITVTDKTDYVHFMWNAWDFKAAFEVKDKKPRLSQSVLQLVLRLYPPDAKADLVKVDVVYAPEDEYYGTPHWDSLQQVAHFEFLKSKALKAFKGKKDPPPAALQKAFDQAVFY